MSSSFHALPLFRGFSTPGQRIALTPHSPFDARVTSVAIAFCDVKGANRSVGVGVTPHRNGSQPLDTGKNLAQVGVFGFRVIDPETILSQVRFEALDMSRIHRQAIMQK